MTAKGKTTVLSLVLLLSLAFNVGLVAWVVGKKTGEFTIPRGGFAGSPALMETVKSLPPGDRQAAMAILKEYRPQIKAGIDELRSERETLRGLLGKPEVDKDALKAAFASMRSKIGRLQQLNQEMVIEMLPHLPFEARQKLLMRSKGGPGRHTAPRREDKEREGVDADAPEQGASERDASERDVSPPPAE